MVSAIFGVGVIALKDMKEMIAEVELVLKGKALQMLLMAPMLLIEK